MARQNELQATVSLNTGPAKAALSQLANDFKRLEANSNTSQARLRSVATQMRAVASAAQSEAGAVKNLAVAQERLNRANNDTKLTTAKVASVKTGTVDRSAESAGRQALVISRQQTEEVRQRVMLEESGSKAQSRELRDQIALRKQQVVEARHLQQTQQESLLGLTAMRYALYGVSAGIAVASAGILAMGVGTMKVAVDWERQFADVRRTTQVSGGEVEFLRQQFVNLNNSLPVTFEQLTKIGTLAGQLGIHVQNVADFTRTVAIFTATTDVSIEDAGVAFGRLNALIPDVKNNFTGLGDAIAKVGVNSVATESQIVKIATQISSVTGAANFGYKATVGLAGALASIAVPPELSRSVITRTFGLITRAADAGGVKLQQFAQISGQSAQDFAAGWSSNAPKQFETFIAGLRAQGDNAETALRALGITSVRDVPILLRLANAADTTGKAGGLLAESFNNAANSAGEMQRQYNIIAGTTASKIQVLFNNIASALDRIGRTNLGFLGDMLDKLTGDIRDFSRTLDEPVKLLGAFELPFNNAELIGWGIAAATVAGALGLVVAALGQVAAGGIAIQQVIGTVTAHFAAKTVAVAADTVALTANTDAQVGNALAAGAAAKQMGGFAGVIRSLGLGLGITALVGLPIVLQGITDALRDAGSTADDVSRSFATAGSPLAALGEIKVGTIGGPDVSGIKDLKLQLEDLSALQDKDFAKRAKLQPQLRAVGADYEFFTNSLKKASDGYQKMIDAGNGDKVINQVIQLGKEARLSSDQLAQYIYSVPALNGLFKDTLAGLDVKPTEKNILSLANGTLPQYNKAMEDALHVTEGTSDAFDDAEEGVGTFIKTISDSLSQFVDFDGAYQSTLDSVNEKGKQAWVKAGNDVSDYVDVATASLDDFLATLEQQVAAQQQFGANLAQVLLRAGPEVAEAAAKLSPQVLQQLVDGAPEQMDRFAAIVAAGGEQSVSQMAANIASLSAPKVQAAFAQMGDDAKAEWVAKIIAGTATIDQLLAAYDPSISVDANTDPASAEVARWGRAVAAQRFQANLDVTARIVNQSAIEAAGRGHLVPGAATGGLITGPGTGTSDSVPTRLSNGEFVITAAATRALGADYLHSLNRSGGRGYADGGYVSNNTQGYVPSSGARFGGGGVNGMDAGQLVALGQAISQALATMNISLYTNDGLLATSVNNGSTQLARQGKN